MRSKAVSVRRGLKLMSRCSSEGWFAKISKKISFVIPDNAETERNLRLGPEG